jgi:hypothetical protein
MDLPIGFFLMVLPFGWSHLSSKLGHSPMQIYWKIGFVVVISTFITYFKPAHHED